MYVHTILAKQRVLTRFFLKATILRDLKSASSRTSIHNQTCRYSMWHLVFQFQNTAQIFHWLSYDCSQPKSIGTISIYTALSGHVILRWLLSPFVLPCPKFWWCSADWPDCGSFCTSSRELPLCRAHNNATNQSALDLHQWQSLLPISEQQ